MDKRFTDCDNLNEFFSVLKNQAKDREECVYIGRHSSRYKSLWKIMEKFDYTSVLDIGCGRGHFGLLLKSLGKNYTGVDIPKNAGICNERGLEAYSANIEQEKLPLKNASFDMVLCLEVIEHLNDMNLLLSEVMRVLKKDGIFIVSTPNSNMPSWRIREIIFRNSIIKGIITGSNRIDEDYKHDRLFKRADIIKIFESSGFEILISEYIRIVLPFDDILVIGRKII